MNYKLTAKTMSTCAIVAWAGYAESKGRDYIWIGALIMIVVVWSA